MCDYLLKVNLDYGEFTMEVDSYNEMMEKYEQLKKDYEHLPCEITAWSNIKDMKLFTKKCGNDNTLEKHYNNIVDSLIKIAELEYQNRKDEISFNDVKFDFNHKIETLNILDDEEILSITKEYKKQLTKRRIIKSEGNKLYAFHDCLLEMIESLHKYRDTQYKKESESCNSKYEKSYYKEKQDKKLNRISRLNNIRPFKIMDQKED